MLRNIDSKVLIALKDRGLSYEKIGKLLGVSRVTISREFKRRGIESTNKKVSINKISDGELERLKERMSYKEIAERYGVGEATVWREFRKRGLNATSRKVSRLLEDLEDKELVGYREEGLSYREIAVKLNVSKSLIIKEYKRRELLDGRNNGKGKLVSMDSLDIVALREEGMTYEEIAELLDVSVVSISNLLRK